MPFIIYRKLPSQSHIVRAPTGRTFPILPVTLMVMGALLIGSVSGPIVAYFLFVSPQLQSPVLISPLPPEEIAPFVQHAQAAPLVYSQLDYRKPENWFPGAELPKPNPAAATIQYSLSIPTLGIRNARVEIGGNDLSTSLIHYPGTANPGELGSPVIFGHSILRQFYDPKNYSSIFSTIMTLKAGDRITLAYDGVQYHYRVIDKIEVKPTDIQILQQKYSGRYLKLVTCVPEGTYLRRGVIIGELERA